MASLQATESPDLTPIASPRTARGGSVVKQRWPSVRASAARKSGLALSKCPKSSVNEGESSKKSRAKMGELKIRSVSQVQTFFKERTLSRADAYIRDRTASEGHIFLKALAPDAPFLDVFKREPPFPKESSSSSGSYEYEEQLEECKRYKEFLVKLTPIDWFEEQAILKAQRDAQRRDLAQGGATLPDPEEEEEVTYFQHPHQILQGQVKLEDEKQATLKKKASINVEGTEHEITFEMLCSKVLSTYLRCGLDPDPSLGSLQMLTMIEARMEEGMQMLRIIPAEFVKATEKAREKERREKAREDNMAALTAAMEERRIRSFERSKAPIFKRIGKPPMPRSVLPTKKKKGGGDKSGGGDDAELAEFLARDY